MLNSTTDLLLNSNYYNVSAYIPIFPSWSRMGTTNELQLNTKLLYSATSRKNWSLDDVSMYWPACYCKLKGECLVLCEIR